MLLWEGKQVEFERGWVKKRSGSDDDVGFTNKRTDECHTSTVVYPALIGREEHFVVCAISLGFPENARDPRVLPVNGCLSRLPVDETTRCLVKVRRTLAQSKITKFVCLR